MLETSERLEPTRYYNDLNGLNRVGFRRLGPLEPLEPALLSVGEVAEAPLPRSDKILQWDNKLGMRVRK